MAGEKEEKSAKRELTEDEIHHRNQIFIAIGATFVLALAIILQLVKYNIENDKIVEQKRETRKAAQFNAAQHAFWVKQEEIAKLREM